MGMLITLFLNPVGWVGAFVGFLLFRVGDIVKPYPANRLEQLHGGIGVMADDAMAAVYANLALRAGHRWHRYLAITCPSESIQFASPMRRPGSSRSAARC